MKIKETPTDVALAYVDIITEFIFFTIIMAIMMASIFLIPALGNAFFIGGLIGIIGYFTLQVWKPVMLIWEFHYNRTLYEAKKDMSKWIHVSDQQKSGFHVIDIIRKSESKVDTLKNGGNKSLLDD